MKARPRTSVLIALAIFVGEGALGAGCASIPTQDIRVHSQADPKANFSGYKSYDWLGAAGVLHDPEGRWEPPGFDAGQEIKFLIDRELRKRGMVADASHPDLYVVFALGIDMQTLDLKKDPETKTDMLTNVPKGALVILLIDSGTGYAIWRGLATGNVQQKLGAATARARLDYAVTQLVKQIPK